jgi:serine/threonine-protein kinase
MLVGYDPGGLRVRISDFGLAKRVNPLTLLASARGTRCFKSPEALRDFQADSCAGDVWALGSTLYLLTGDRLPYTDPAGRGLEDMPDYNRPLLQPSLLNYQVDPRLEQIIVRCLAIRPQERYPTARELLADLEAWRPASAPARLPAYEQPSSKAALGPAASPNQSSAESMARRALTLAQSAAGLGEAADLMEEAFNLWPALRSQYEYNVRLWRRGIMS